MTAITHTGPTGVVSAYNYTYGPNGNRTQQIETNAGRTETTLYDYELTNRLKTVTYEAGTATANQVSYTYDRVGNRLTERAVALQTSTVTKHLTNAYDAINRLETIDDVIGAADVTYAYDANGNTLSKSKAGVTTEFLYNIRNQLGEVRQETSVLGRYGYDAEGMRILKIGDDGRRQYTYDQLSVITEANESNATVSKYDYGLDQLVSLDNTSEGRSFFHLDFLGSTANLTETVGSTRQSILYDAWGNERDRIGTSANKFTFTGHEKDEETGLIYAKARFYDPDIGRFLTQDDVTGRADSPPSLHRYYYVHQNPLFFVDPTGNVALIQKIRKKMRQFQEDIIDWAVEDEEQKDRHKKDPLGAGMGAGIASSVVGFGEKALGLVNTASNAAIVWFAAYTGYTDSELITDSADELVAGIKDLATVARTVDEHGLYQTIGEVAWDGAKSTGIKIYDASQGDVRAIAELTAGAMEITAEVVVGTKGMAALSRGRAASTMIRETVESGAARSTTAVRRTAQGTNEVVELSVVSPHFQPKRFNVGPSGHHVPAVRKSRGRPFGVARSDKTRPTLFSNSADPGFDHWRMHRAERNVIGPRQGAFRGTDDELFDAYREAYKGLDDIRVDVRSPDGSTVLGTDVTPSQGVDLIETWLREKGKR